MQHKPHKGNMCIISLSLFWILCIQNIVYFDQISDSAQLHAKHYYILWDVMWQSDFDSRCFLIVSVFWTRWVFGSICVLCCYLNSKCRSWHGQTGALFLFLSALNAIESTVYFICGRLCAWRNFRHQNGPLLSACSLISFRPRRLASDWTQGSAHASNACNHASWKTSVVDWAKWTSLPWHLTYG